MNETRVNIADTASIFPIIISSPDYIGEFPKNCRILDVVFVRDGTGEFMFFVEQFYLHNRDTEKRKFLIRRNYEYFSAYKERYIKTVNAFGSHLHIFEDVSYARNTTGDL